MSMRSIMMLNIGVITPLFAWILLKSLALNSSSGHNPDPWLQSLVDQPQIFRQDQPTMGWFKVISQNDELFWEQRDHTLKPLAELPAATSATVFLIDARGPRAAHLFYDYLKSNNLVDKALILSSSDGLTKDLLFYDINLKLSCGQAYLIRLRMLQQLGLSNLMKTTMSAAWAEDSLFKNDLESFAEDLQTRRVPLFIGPFPEAISTPFKANQLIL